MEYLAGLDGRNQNEFLFLTVLALEKVLRGLWRYSVIADHSRE